MQLDCKSRESQVVNHTCRWLQDSSADAFPHAFEQAFGSTGVFERIIGLRNKARDTIVEAIF